MYIRYLLFILKICTIKWHIHRYLNLNATQHNEKTFNCTRSEHGRAGARHELIILFTTPPSDNIL